MAPDEEVTLSAEDQAAHNDALRAAIAAARIQTDQHLSDMHEESKRQKLASEGEALAAQLAGMQQTADAQGTTLSGIAAMRAAAAPESAEDDNDETDAPTETAAAPAAAPVSPAAPVLPAPGTKEVKN